MPRPSLRTRAGRSAAVSLGLALAISHATTIPLHRGGPLRSGTAPAGRANAIEIRGSSVFVKAPWKVDLISYYTTVGQPQPEYFLTLELDPDAGASHASLS